ncbi:RluA family pseudouridine synthase [Maricaulis sp.]|uniref:RluA family pseudouridine synthase n=1 Tax=Maricaulis sp. TaxID=1486257 RepID=UPI003A8F6794
MPGRDTHNAALRPFEYTPPPVGPLPVLHRDDHILVIDKPSGLLTVPGNRPERADCLEARARDDFPTARIIHRLDMDTSGVIVLALTAHAQAHIGKQFEKRMTSKSYIAIVQGEMAGTTGRVDQPIITDWPNRPRQMICHERGRNAVTDWEVLEITDGVTRVRLSPLTGRSHQLRVHMLHLGHPILGDNLYAPPEALAASDRLCLHAQQLGFRHPDGGAPVSFDSPAPF